MCIYILIICPSSFLLFPHISLLLLVFPLKRTQWVQLVLPSCICVWRLSPTRAWTTSPVATALRKMTVPPPREKPSCASSLSARDRTSWAPPQSLLGCWLLDRVQVTFAAVSSWVQQPCQVGQTHFHGGRWSFEGYWLRCWVFIVNPTRFLNCPGDTFWLWGGEAHPEYGRYSLVVWVPKCIKSRQAPSFISLCCLRMQCDLLPHALAMMGVIPSNCEPKINTSLHCFAQVLWHRNKDSDTILAKCSVACSQPVAIWSLDWVCGFWR